MPTPEKFGHRERQIMDILYHRGRATVADVRADLPDPPSYSAVRGMLRLLEDKGHVRHEQDGPRYVYMATVNRERVRKSAAQHLVRVFFDNSATSAVAAMLGMYEKQLNHTDLDRLEALIQRARTSGGSS
jgi:predicted transcriptional regulator